MNSSPSPIVMWITLNNVKSDSSTARHGGGDVRYQIIRGCLRMRAAYWRPPRPVSLTLSLVLPPKQPARCSDEIQNSNAKLTFKNYKLFSARSRARFFFAFGNASVLYSWCFLICDKSLWDLSVVCDFPSSKTFKTKFYKSNIIFKIES